MTHESVVRYVRERAGDSLRVIAEYDRDGYEMAYLRDDLDREKVERRASVLHGYLSGSDRSEPDEVTTALGDPYASVQLRESAVIVNLVTEDRAGVLVSMETSVCRDLHGFVDECLARVDGGRRPAEAGP